MTRRLIELAVSVTFIQSQVKERQITVNNKPNPRPKKQPQNPRRYYNGTMRAAERRIERACREDLWRERLCRQFEVRQQPEKGVRTF